MSETARQLRDAIEEEVRRSAARTTDRNANSVTLLILTVVATSLAVAVVTRALLSAKTDDVDDPLFQPLQ